MNRLAFPILAVALVVISQVCCCGDLFRAIKAVPTMPPTPQLEKGRTYWLGGITWPMQMYWVDLMSLPASSLENSQSTIVAVVSDSSEVELLGVQEGWCYVKVIHEYQRDAVLPPREGVEGWVECRRLLDYQPTPLPTPILTPQEP
jgi:hypothetical protein